MFTTRRNRRLFRFAAAGFVLVLVAAGALAWVFRDVGAKQITAYFDETIGVYAGSDLRILGVTVGTIDSVQPEGTQVKVVMTLDDGIAVPANPEAVVVSPSVVSDRYIQLAPAYTGGPQVKDGTVIPVSRTETPVELDQLYSTLNELSTALGPNGANANGALSDLLNTGAANLDGNGAALGNMIQQLGAATRTLSGSQDNLFQTINSLQQFTTMLKNNNSQVQSVTQQLASVSGFLADDRQNLGLALNELADALGQVQSFISNNRGEIKSNVDKLASISQVLVDQRASLAEALDDAPLAVDNLLGAYDPTNHTLDGRGDLLELAPQSGPTGKPSALLASTPTCSYLDVGSSSLDAACAAGGGNGLMPVGPTQQRALPELPLPTSGTVYGTAKGGGQ
ncbi:MAG TPA: MCE family protein [Pseudonocardiaceae bacterium]|jgi:virulence factor Mce-like protein|nr:MCE family protein [Pseudonocardiaceae bacterium]